VEKSKRKNGELNSKRYWQIFGTLAIILLVMLRFPVRVWLSETLDDILIFGTLSLGCLYTAIHVYRHSKWQFRRLIAVILLCATLSAWQVLDLGVLRYTYVRIVEFGYYGEDIPDYFGYAWYIPRFPNDDIMCHSIFERYIGSYHIAITTEIKHVPWFACGG
jgi:hypothetical protein